jgi:diguanylate cyclase (GGDEF)-like protein
MPHISKPVARALRTGAIITFASVFFSIVPVWIWLQLDPVIDTASIYISTIMLPLLIAPTCSFFILRAQLRAQSLARENHRLANLDDLTGLPNRRAFFTGAKKLQAEAGAEQGIFVCAIADVEDFKRINDSYGHDTGDKVLIAIAQTLARIKSDELLIARMGGEEFAIAGLFVDEEAAGKAFDALVKAVAQTDYLRESVTLSLGYALDAGNESISSMLSRADALYLAKVAGKNCIHRQLKTPSYACAKSV